MIKQHVLSFELFLQTLEEQDEQIKELTGSSKTLEQELEEVKKNLKAQDTNIQTVGLLLLSHDRIELALTVRWCICTFLFIRQLT